MGGLIGGAMGGIIGAIKGSLSGIDETGGGKDTSRLSARNPRLLKDIVNGVEVAYKSSSAKQPIDFQLADQLEEAIRLTKAEFPELNKITISATTNDHLTGLHPRGFAVDISRINDIRIGWGYQNNVFVGAVVETLQINLDKIGSYHSIYGQRLLADPYGNFTEKLIQEHLDHIHYSVMP